MKPALRIAAEGAPEAEFPAGYRMTASGLVFEMDNEKRLLAGPFTVLAQSRDKHGNAWGLLVEWRDADNQPHRVSIPKAELVGDGVAVRRAMADGGLFVAPGHKERTLLLSFLAQVRIDRRARAVPRVGWADNAFALPDRTIAPAGERNLVVYQGALTAEHDYRTAGTLDGWQDEVAEPCAGNSRLVLALSAAFVGPLLEVAGAEGGGIHLRGASSIGKSTALKAAASVWGGPGIVRQWRATANGLEAVAEQASETLLVLDELAQLDTREAGQAAYLLANGTGKARANASGDARACRTWRVFFLSSGELSLAEHAASDGRGWRSPAGQEVRILDLEADAGQGLGLFDTLGNAADGETLARSITAGAAAHYGDAGPAFVEALLSGMDKLGSELRRFMDRFTGEHCPLGATGQVQRALRRFALIAAAGELAVQKGILPWGQGEAEQAAKRCFAAWLAGRGGEGAAEDMAALEQVRQFLQAHGGSRFQPIDKDAGYVVHNRVGFTRQTTLGETEFLIPAEQWKGEVCQGLSATRVAKLLAERGALVPDSQSKSSQTVKLPDLGRTRCYVLRPAALDAGSP